MAEPRNFLSLISLRSLKCLHLTHRMNSARTLPVKSWSDELVHVCLNRSCLATHHFFSILQLHLPSVISSRSCLRCHFSTWDSVSGEVSGFGGFSNLARFMIISFVPGRPAGPEFIEHGFPEAVRVCYRSRSHFVFEVQDGGFKALGDSEKRAVVGHCATVPIDKFLWTDSADAGKLGEGISGILE